MIPKKGKNVSVKNVDGGKTALDVGCREGYQSRWLEKKGYKVTSIDIEKKYSKCQVVDVNNPLPFANNTFDLIWCSEVIEHLIDPKKSVEEFRRVLKPNGKMILTTPNSYFWLMRPLHWLGLSPKKLQNPDHKHFFNEKAIRQLFPNARIYGFFPYAFLKYEIYRLIGHLSPTFVMCEKMKSR